MAERCPDWFVLALGCLAVPLLACMSGLPAPAEQGALPHGDAQFEFEFKNAMSGSGPFLLRDVLFQMDGRTFYREKVISDGSAHKQAFALFAASLPAGAHVVKGILEYRGNGSVTLFTLTTSHALTAVSGKTLRIAFTALEGGTAPRPLDTRPRVDWHDELRLVSDGGDTSLQVGDLGYSVDHGSVVAVAIRQTHRTRVQGHHVVHVALADGRELRISAGHPTANGRTFGDLRMGDSLAGIHVERLEDVPYDARIRMTSCPIPIRAPTSQAAPSSEARSPRRGRISMRVSAWTWLSSLRTPYRFQSRPRGSKARPVRSTANRQRDTRVAVVLGYCRSQSPSHSCPG